MPRRGSALVLLLGGLALVFATLAGYFYLSSSAKAPAEQVKPAENKIVDEAAKWKTYRNTDYKFELQYPPNLELSHISEREDKAINSQMVTVLSFLISAPDQEFASSENKKDLRAVGFQLITPALDSELVQSCPEKTKNKTCFEKIISINGVRAMVSTYEVPEGEASGSKDRDIGIIMNNLQIKFYTQVYSLPQNKEVAELNNEEFTIDKIASTFKFLDQNSDQTANWKTLSDDRGNLSYSFQYPPDWGNFEYTYCKTTPNPKHKNLSSGCIEMLVFSENLPSEDTFNMARDVVLTSEIQTKVSRFIAKRRVYELAESTLEGPKPISGEPPSSYELWVYDSDNKPFFLLLVYIGDGTDLKIATEFVGDLDRLTTTLKIQKKS